MPKLLTDHDDIRAWVAARAGSPAITEVPDGHGGTRPHVQFVFGQRAYAPDADEVRDDADAFELVGWSEWFAAFDAQNLSIRVATPGDGWPESGYQIEKRAEART